MNHLLVIGGASLDVLHLKDRTVKSPGGAGMYTAMAARRCGAQVTLLAPRPDPCPESLLPVARHLLAWLGPVVSPEQLPHFEISYRDAETKYLQVSFGAEVELSPAMLPADLSQFDLVHLIPLGNAARQLSLVKACRQRGARRISAGTGLTIATENPRAVRAILDQVDYFFMNDQEAGIVFGSLESASIRPGKFLFITSGALGARIIQGGTTTSIPAVPAAELDPTGAGDAFCGATLAYLLQGHQPIMAARQAASLAAEMIAQVGPTALLSDDPPPETPLDPRVRIDAGQVQKVADMVSNLTEVSPFSFVSPQLPPAGHFQALEYFFAATAQQIGFWWEKDGRYDRPLLARLGGVLLKGSDYLWEAFRRQVMIDPEFCLPERQANLTHRDLQAVFRDDDGHDPMPALELRLAQAQQYGRDMLALGLTPQALLQEALASAQPLLTFLSILDHIGGYKEDPLRKKSGLLALILNQRPELFLPLRSDEQVAPVIDYHLMRSCLRVGLVEISDEQLKDKVTNRQSVSPADEWAIRYAAYRAIEQVVSLSGTDLGAVDFFFFGARKRCPEMSEPECSLCPLDPICAHRKDLFQPVLRTTFY
jgi:sugar/nucleoside kinase (ribokinase family)